MAAPGRGSHDSASRLERAALVFALLAVAAQLLAPIIALRPLQSSTADVFAALFDAGRTGAKGPQLVVT